MQITALGHSCILLDLPRSDQGSTRILVDPWLSDHATGDGMGRFPRLRFDVAALGQIDGIFISHAHSDHLDPYSLVRLWQELSEPPVLLLPVSLTYLVPLFRAHLAPLEVLLLKPHEPRGFHGVELLGFFDIGDTPTNEEDVMVLVVTNGTEVVLVEADANLSLEVPEFREYITELLQAPGIESAVFLTTENELTGTLASATCATQEDREDVVDMAMNELLESVVELYAPVDNPEEDLWNGRVLRLIHGQGLTAPHELDPRWQQVLFPIRIQHRVREERAAAERSGFSQHIHSLTVGCVHTIAGARVVAREPLEELELLDPESARIFLPALPFFPKLPLAPLRADERDVARQRADLLSLLNQRFLPYLHGSRLPPVLHLLSGLGGSYRIRLHYGQDLDGESWDYLLNFSTHGFTEMLPEDEPDEAYWANDLDDFLQGRCDEFSSFCRTQFPGEMRLWACLAMPLLNGDLVAKRVALHFERATQGLSPGSFVLERYSGLT